MAFSQDLVRGSVIPIVLKLLAERPMYGYEIAKVVNRRTGGKLEWKEGTLYPALHKLEAQRMVSSKWADSPSATGSGRKRKYYAITAKGARQLAKRSAEWEEFTTAVNAVLMGA